MVRCVINEAVLLLVFDFQSTVPSQKDQMSEINIKIADQSRLSVNRGVMRICGRMQSVACGPNLILPTPLLPAFSRLIFPAYLGSGRAKHTRLATGAPLLSWPYFCICGRFVQLLMPHVECLVFSFIPFFPRRTYAIVRTVYLFCHACSRRHI